MKENKSSQWQASTCVCLRMKLNWSAGALKSLGCKITRRLALKISNLGTKSDLYSHLKVHEEFRSASASSKCSVLCSHSPKSIALPITFFSPFLFLFIFLILSNRICGLKGRHTSQPTSSLGSYVGLKSSPSLLWVWWPTNEFIYLFIYLCPHYLSDCFQGSRLKYVGIRFACKKEIGIDYQIKILNAVGWKTPKKRLITR